MRRHSARSAIMAGTVALTVAQFGVAPAHAQQKSISLLIAGSSARSITPTAACSRTTSGGIYRETRTSS